MNLRFSAVMALAATVIGGAASAQEFTYFTYGSSYGNVGTTSGDIDIYRLSFSGEYDANPFFLAGGFSAQGADGPLGTAEQYRIDALAGYLIEPQLMLYLDLQATHVGGGDTYTRFSPGIEHTREKRTVGFYLEGDSDSIPVTVAYYGHRFSEETEVMFQLSHNDISDTIVYTLVADHEFEGLELTALWSGEENAPNNVIGVHSSYDFDNDFRLLGGMTYIEDMLSNSTKLYDFGAGYQLRDNMWLDATYTKVDGSTNLEDSFFIGIRFEQGDHRLLRHRIEAAQSQAFSFLTP